MMLATRLILPKPAAAMVRGLTATIGSALTTLTIPHELWSSCASAALAARAADHDDKRGGQADLPARGPTASPPSHRIEGTLPTRALAFGPSRPGWVGATGPSSQCRWGKNKLSVPWLHLAAGRETGVGQGRAKPQVAAQQNGLGACVLARFWSRWCWRRTGRSMKSGFFGLWRAIGWQSLPPPPSSPRCLSLGDRVEEKPPQKSAEDAFVWIKSLF